MTNTPSETVVAARELAAKKDWEGVRELLAPTVAEQGRGMSLLLLARAEYELGNPAAAEPLVGAFLDQRPGHTGAHLLTARVKLATGDLEAAEDAARIGAALADNEGPYERVLRRIDAIRAATYDPTEDLAAIDAGYLEARRSGPPPELIEAARRVARVAPGHDWRDDVREAKIAFFHHAPDAGAALHSYDPHLIDVSTRFGYTTWPRRIQEHVRGKKVLDVGCGFGGFGMGFLIAGATSYAGIDPDMDLDSTRARDKRVRRWDDMGVTPRQIADELPAVRLFRRTVEDHGFDEQFDTIALHNVTEHLHDIDEVFAGLTALCHPGTTLVLLHHNYYSWNGHHQAPVQPAQLDETDVAHQQVYDWRHVNALLHLPEGHEIRTLLNRIRLDDLRASIEKHFDITQWDEVPSNEETRARLTPEIVERVRHAVPDITERELTVNTVLCVARPQS